MPSGDEVSHLEEEVARLRAELGSVSRQADQWREVAEERRATLERFRQHPIVRILFAIAGVVLPPMRRAKKRARVARGPLLEIRRSLSALRALPWRLRAPAQEEQLLRAARRLPASPHDERTVSFVVLTRDGHDRLRRLFPALRSTIGDPEIVLVDNASQAPTRRFLGGEQGIERLRLDEHLSYAAANNRGASRASSEVLCFLNDDVEPLEPGWLARMLAELTDEVAAVGAQLVYPRRPLFGARTRDLTVQHLGIELAPTSGGVPQAGNVGGMEPDPHRPVREVAAVTGACLLVRRADFLGAGGFDERYEFGAEDVDLCWRLREDGRIVVAPSAVLWHHEGSTRHQQDPKELNRRQSRNWGLLADRFGPELARAVECDRLRSERVLSSEPYRLAITITRDLEEAGYGDWYTAHELGHRCEELGWRVSYPEKYRDAWYDLDGDVDCVLSLHDTFDIRRVARPGLTTIAWARNWLDRWMNVPWFGSYDEILVPSERAAKMVRKHTGRGPIVMPLATNPRRFGPGVGERDGVVFPGNYWGKDQRLPELVRAVPQLVVYGKGWEEVPEVRDRWRGHLPYEQLPTVYQRAAVAVDQAAQHTRAFASVNSRVFDAIASGALPVTDQVEGVRELFGDLVPTYQDPDELAEIVQVALSDPEERDRRVGELRQIVLEHHTYDRRARELRDLLLDRGGRPSLLLRTSVPDRKVAETWGDWHLAEAFGLELHGAGHRVHVQTRDEWGDRDGRSYDVAVHLKGRSRAPVSEGQVNVIWNISHPEELTPEECEDSDLVLVGSERFASELRRLVDTPVEVMLQGTDPDRFHPLPPEPRYEHDLVFVGNSRFAERPIVRDLIGQGFEPAIYGGNWERYVDPDLIRGTFVPNEDVPRIYSSARIVLNDHWEGMSRWGYVSNRIFDALACGACVVSDDLPELHELFGDAVGTYRSPAELGELVGELLADEHRRAEMGRAGREIVLAHHTFARRADRFRELVEPHARERGLLTG